jgi:hypothetical protein
LKPRTPQFYAADAISEEYNMSKRDFDECLQNFDHCRATKTILRIVAFCCAATCATAAPVKVCLVNEASVSRDALRYVEAGLTAHEKELAITIRFICESDSDDAVIIRLRNVPAPNQHPDALGAALMEDGKVLRQVEVFCHPIRRMVGTRWPLSPALEGWSLATVAAHEMYHYLYNEHAHGKGRLNGKFATPEELVRGFRNVSLTTSRSD